MLVQIRLRDQIHDAGTVFGFGKRGQGSCFISIDDDVIWDFSLMTEPVNSKFEYNRTPVCCHVAVTVDPHLISDVSLHGCSRKPVVSG